MSEKELYRKQLADLLELKALSPHDPELLNLIADLNTLIEFEELKEAQELEARKKALLESLDDKNSYNDISDSIFDDSDSKNDSITATSQVSVLSNSTYDNSSTAPSDNLKPSDTCCILFTHTDNIKYYLPAIIISNIPSTNAYLVVLPTPISSSLVPCPNFLSSSCTSPCPLSLSHGIELPYQNVFDYGKLNFETGFAEGDFVWAKYQNDKQEVWYKSRFLGMINNNQKSNDDSNMRVIYQGFESDGEYLVSSDMLMPLRFADPTQAAEAAGSMVDIELSNSESESDQEDDDGSDRSEGDESDGEEVAFVRFHAAVHDGLERVDPEFGAWEQHTRGIGSKLMAAMGYKPGTALGADPTSSTSLVNPIPIQIFSGRKGLDFLEDDEKKSKLKSARQHSQSSRRRRRGIRKQRNQKKSKILDDSAIDQKQSETSVFDFMNVTLNKSTQLSSNTTTSLRPSSHSSSFPKHPLKPNQPSRSTASTSQPKSGPNILHLHKHLNTLNSSLSSAQQSYERHKSKDPITANKFMSKVNKLMTEIKHTEAIIGREEKKKKGAREREKWLEF